MKTEIIATGILTLLSQNQNGQEAKVKRAAPNLLIIIADQWRGQDLGILGLEPVKTPNLDRLARESAVYAQCVSGYPVSSPARAMLMSGMYPLSNKVTANCNSNSAPFGVELPGQTRCWSDVLSEKGYKMGYIGKWHLDAPYKPFVNTSNNKGGTAWNEWTPPQRRHGFADWYAYGTYDQHTRPMYWGNNDPRDGFSYVDQWGPEHEAEKAIEFIEKTGNERFSLVVSMNPPHMPYELVPEKYKKMYESADVEALCKSPDIPPRGTQWGDYYRKNIRNYFAMMTGVDENIGKIIDYLKAKGQFDNTIIVFTSDHGNCLGIHEELSKNNLYEESMRVPLIISYPGRIKPSVNNELLISFEDLYPTLLSLMGYKKDIPATVETRDLSEQLTGKGKMPEYQPYMKYDFNNLTSGYRGVRTIRYTYVVRFVKGEKAETFLFDRAKDPYQMENIAGTRQDIEIKLMKFTADWLRKAKDPLANNFTVPQ